jgi:group I intron endonuclease
MSGVIYQITCKSTNLKYVGQATNLKYKNGKPYNYGANGRWSDHVSTSKTRNTPLCNAIKKYGKDNFTIEVIEEALLETLDEKEAYWILKKNTVYPNGYNVASHSRNRHRDTSNLHIFYQDKVKSAIIAPIKQDGQFKMAYVYLTLNDDSQERIAFGQKSDSTYEDTLVEVNEFLTMLKCPYTMSTTTSDKLSEKYASKLNEFKHKEITSVRITSASNLIAVYIGTSEMKLNSEHKRICFGGKTITKEEAYEIAKQFVAELNVSDKLIKNSIESRQQAAAS